MNSYTIVETTVSLLILFISIIIIPIISVNSCLTNTAIIAYSCSCVPICIAIQFKYFTSKSTEFIPTIQLICLYIINTYAYIVHIHYSCFSKPITITLIILGFVVQTCIFIKLAFIASCPIIRRLHTITNNHSPPPTYSEDDSFFNTE